METRIKQLSIFMYKWVSVFIFCFLYLYNTINYNETTKAFSSMIEVKLIKNNAFDIICNLTIIKRNNECKR